MIIFNRKKINRNFIKNLQMYLNITNFGYLECPHCHSHDIILWGFYERNVIFFSDSDSPKIKSTVIKVQRSRCKSCGKTHALLPNGIVPYKQFTSEVIITILLNVFHSSIEKTANSFSINISIIKKIYYQFSKHHKSRLSTLTKNIDLLTSLQLINTNFELQMDYIIQYNCCFMQSKLGCIGIAPL